MLALFLPLAVPGGAANAQTISNTAEARWTVGGETLRTTSNEVVFDVEQSPPEISTFRSSPSSNLSLNFFDAICAATNSVPTPTPSTTGSGSTSGTHTLSVEETDIVHVGQNLIFEIKAATANDDPNAIDSLMVTIETSTGDTERFEVFETSENSGIFVGEVGTMHMPPAPTSGDCRLSLVDASTITVSASRPGQSDIIVTANVDVLADPFGVVFDSETGDPVDGVQVTLVDNATGQPATVFGEDGVTAWPSTVISGQPITDAAGNTFIMGPGEFWFPLTYLGEYRLEVVTPEPYTAPSIVTPEQIADLTRADGRSFVILDGSYGAPFQLDDPTPVQIDIPVDRPSLDVSLTKTASRQSVQPGDIVFYTLTARNTDPSRIKRDVVLTDTPARSLRLRQDSVRVDGVAAPDAVTVANDASRITVNLGDIAGGETRRVTYAMSVDPNATPGQAVNTAVTVDSLGRTATARASVDIERDTLTGRMTVIGRIATGDCTLEGSLTGVPGVRVMMEDGSFAVTDADGRYHFDGVVPGTHVVQASGMTLPDGADFADCDRSTRHAGSTNSRFVIGQGGSLVVADFFVKMPTKAMETLIAESEAAKANDPVAPAPLGGEASDTAAIEKIDWLALGDGEDGWLAPAIDANPRAPAIRVAIRHRKGQTIALRVDGEPVDGLAFDGTKSPRKGKFAVSEWRGVPLRNERTVLSADIINSFGEVNETIEREVFFTNTPTRVELLPEQSNLVADGRTKPVIAVRVLDRNNRPLREGVAGEFIINEPYQSAEQLERQQLSQLTGIAASSSRWVVEGDEGIARIELAPTMVSGSVRLDFRFDDGEVVREQQLETWIEPGDIEWTIVGLAEGSIGALTVADNMERADNFDSDLGDKARVALYAKGRVLGKFLMTLAYDSAKQKDDQRLLGTLDPAAYYTVFGDASSRRFDAASREKLYVRIETSTFYALYGDFETGFDQTRLARYNRTATGVKAEARLGQFHAQAFAADVASRYRRDEIQGAGISGPYRLSSRAILANSERVVLETRDRFRSDLVVATRELVRFIDYDLDLLSGTISFKQPVMSRDFDLNPQFIVIDYEVDTLANGELNAGARVDWTDKADRIRVGASVISDKGDAARTDIAGVDVRARISDQTEVRAEVALSRSEGETAKGWLVEAQHQTGKLDVLAYARSTDADFGVGQQSGAELGRRKFGVDGRVKINDKLSFLGSAWQDDSLSDDTRRRALQGQMTYSTQNTDLQLGLSHFSDRLADGEKNTSTVLEGGVTQRLANNKLELSATSSIALDDTESVDLPTRHRFGARYAITNDVRIVGLYEIADGENIDARTISGGIELTPWSGGQVVTSLGKQRIDENGERSFAAFGLAQSLQVTPSLTVDATIDGSRTLNGTPAEENIINLDHPVASGGLIAGNTAFEDFTALTLGAAWRKDRWSATARGEYRDGEFVDRKGVTLGAIRQLGEGRVVGSGFTWTQAEGANGATSEILDGALAYAHRPAASEFAMLGKLEFRSDRVSNAVAGEVGPAGRTALLVDGDAKSTRVIASLSTNWSPRVWEDIASEDDNHVRRDEHSVFMAVRHNFDRYEGFDLSGTSVFAGADMRWSVTDKIEVGARGTVRANLDDNTTAFSIGPNVGVVPAKGVLLTVGYNIKGFRDEDFSARRDTDKGVYASVRMKIDADTFSFLGLGR